jgi:hypothetical protein
MAKISEQREVEDEGKEDIFLIFSLSKTEKLIK